MGEFIPVMAASELGPGQCREVLVGGKPVALFNVEGIFYALSNVCLHRGGPLGQGSLDGAVVMCPWHAWTWDVRTGENTANGSLKVACYDTKVEAGQVAVKVD